MKQVAIIQQNNNSIPSNPTCSSVVLKVFRGSDDALQEIQKLYLSVENLRGKIQAVNLLMNDWSKNNPGSMESISYRLDYLKEHARLLALLGLLDYPQEASLPSYYLERGEGLVEGQAFQLPLEAQAFQQPL